MEAAAEVAVDKLLGFCADEQEIEFALKVGLLAVRQSRRFINEGVLVERANEQERKAFENYES